MYLGHIMVLANIMAKLIENIFTSIMILNQKFQAQNRRIEPKDLTKILIGSN